MMQQIICTTCGTSNDDLAKFCVKCGSLLSSDANSSQSSQSNAQPPQGGYQPPQGGYQPPQGSYPPPPNGYQPPRGYYQPPQGYQPPPGVVQKSKIAAGLFGILLGAFGVHNFYLGYTGKAIAQLLITVLSCGALSVVSFVWGLIEGILILTDGTAVDAHGIPLKD
jgi:TM2 domain-containing membrane protein YozV